MSTLTLLTLIGCLLALTLPRASGKRCRNVLQAPNFNFFATCKYRNYDHQRKHLSKKVSKCKRWDLNDDGMVDRKDVNLLFLRYDEDRNKKINSSECRRFWLEDSAIHRLLALFFRISIRLKGKKVKNGEYRIAIEAINKVADWPADNRSAAAHYLTHVGTRRFSDIDKNGDGLIKVRVDLPSFSYMDENGDGKITFREVYRSAHNISFEDWRKGQKRNNGTLPLPKDFRIDIS